MSAGVLFWSDLHIGHKFMAELRGFASVEDHDEALLEKWNSAVTKRDIVYVLGDVAMNHHKGIAWMRKANGQKYLIAGNHDQAHSINPRWAAATRACLANDIFLGVTMAASMKIAGQKVMMSHFPYEVDHVPAARFMEWRLRDEGLWLLHGHTHVKTFITGERQLHVGVDAWQRPVPRDLIEEHIAEHS